MKPGLAIVSGVALLEAMSGVLLLLFPLLFPGFNRGGGTGGRGEVGDRYGEGRGFVGGEELGGWYALYCLVGYCNGWSDCWYPRGGDRGNSISSGGEPSRPGKEDRMGDGPGEFC